MYDLVTLGAILLTVLCVPTSPHHHVLCPLQCDCHHQKDRHIINCSHRNLTSLPFLCNLENDVSGKNVEFYANGNKFRYVLKSAFYHVRNRLSHLEITSNSYNIELAHLAFNNFVDSLEVLKLEPVYENVNTLVNSLKSLNKLKVLHLTSATDGFQILSSKFTQPNLSEISLQKCGIQNISHGVFREVDDLTILNLSFNHLADFPQELVAAVSKSVSVLTLSNNEISEVNEEDIAKGCQLEFLDLSFNSISFVEEGVLDKCLRLRFLNLSHNPNLISLGRAVFDGLIGLLLDVSHSPISSLDFVKPEVFVGVLAYGTNLECSCDVQVKYIGALQGNLKGTCIIKSNITDIQSNNLDCEQYKQRQKRIRFNMNSEREKSFDLDTNIASDPNRLEQDSGPNVHNELYTSMTEVDYLDDSQVASRRNCNNNHCTNSNDFKSDSELITEHDNVADFGEPHEKQKEFLELSAHALSLNPSASAGSSLEISSTPIRSVPIRPGPIRSEPIRSSTTSSFQASPVVNFEMPIPPDLPKGDTLATKVDSEPNEMAQKMPTKVDSEPNEMAQKMPTKVDSEPNEMAQKMPVTPQMSKRIFEADREASEASYKAVVLSTSMLDISMIMPESTPSFTPEMSSAKPEMPSVARNQQVFAESLNSETLSNYKPEADTFSCTHTSHEHPTLTSIASSQQQTPAACGDRDHIIQPSTTINIINSISSTITYKRDYTYFIKHVNHLNPQFSPPPKAKARETQYSKPDAPSGAPGAEEKCKGNEFKEAPRESDHQRHPDAGATNEDGPTYSTRVYFFEGPLYLMACFVHACLLFAAFLKLEPGVKIKQ